MIERIEIEKDGTVQFFFPEEPNHPFFAFEFLVGSEHQVLLHTIETHIKTFNTLKAGRHINNLRSA